MRFICIFIFLMFFSVGGIGSVCAQDGGGDADRVLRCRYSYWFKEEPDGKDRLDKTMCLDINGTDAIYYSEKYYLMESASFGSAVQSNGSGFEVKGNAEFGGTKEKSRYFIDYAGRSYEKYDSSLENEFHAPGKLETPEWRFQDTVTVICGYECRRAVADYLGRTWIVWYAPEIPVSAGPWLLWGAPGLILRAGDADGYFTFNADEIGYAQEDRTELLRYMSDVSSRMKTYKDIRRMEMTMNRVRRSYSADCQLAGVSEARIVNVHTGEESGFDEVRKYIPLIPDGYWEWEGGQH